MNVPASAAACAAAAAAVPVVAPVAVPESAAVVPPSVPFVLELSEPPEATPPIEPNTEAITLDADIEPPEESSIVCASKDTSPLSSVARSSPPLAEKTLSAEKSVVAP